MTLSRDSRPASQPVSGEQQQLRPPDLSPDQFLAAAAKGRFRHVSTRNFREPLALKTFPWSVKWRDTLRRDILFTTGGDEDYLHDSLNLNKNICEKAAICSADKDVVPLIERASQLVKKGGILIDANQERCVKSETRYINGSHDNKSFSLSGGVCPDFGSWPDQKRSVPSI